MATPTGAGARSSPQSGNPAILGSTSTLAAFVNTEIKLGIRRNLTKQNFILSYFIPLNYFDNLRLFDLK
jgi:hypothetical protein